MTADTGGRNGFGSRPNRLVEAFQSTPADIGGQNSHPAAP